MRSTREAQEHSVKVANSQLLSMEQQRVSDLFLKVLEIIRNSAPVPTLSESDIKMISNEDAAFFYHHFKLSGMLDVNQPSKIMHLLSYIESSKIAEEDKRLLIDQLRLTLTATDVFLLALSLAPGTFND